jgi:hypothetical protein
VGGYESRHSAAYFIANRGCSRRPFSRDWKTRASEIPISRRVVSEDHAGAQVGLQGNREASGLSAGQVSLLTALTAKSAGLEYHDLDAPLSGCDAQIKLIPQAIEKIVLTSFSGLHVECIHALHGCFIDNRTV